MRLIDADRLKESIIGNSECVEIIKHWIDCQPTVPAKLIYPKKHKKKKRK